MGTPKGSERDGPAHIRFWANVTKIDGDGCWTWTGRSRCNGGYGKLSVRGRATRAHRFSWELHNGPIPDGLQVLHRCDNPPCVRPDHLFLGTPADNSHDQVSKGRNFVPYQGFKKQRKAACKHGHPYDESNTYWYKESRRCWACKLADQRRRRRKRAVERRHTVNTLT